MKRWGSVVSLFMMFAVYTCTAAAVGTVGASIHLRAPSSIPSGQAFRVTAWGYAPRKGSGGFGQYVVVFGTYHSACASTAARAENRGDAELRFQGTPEFVAVKYGAYSVTSNKAYPPMPGKALLCGYLYSGVQPANTKPEAHASHSLTVT